MTTIQLLDSATINQIAAGEVIDRPQSVVKELIENSIDAEANIIKISIQSGGIQRIQIEDNGKGLSVEDLLKAPLRYATSKIRKLDDIYTDITMGFRGEALASIAHVSDLSISSRQISEDIGYQIDVKGDDISDPKEIARQVGTTVSVSHLFQSIPVRRKYLKKPGTEQSYIVQEVQHLALAYPEIGFQLMADGEDVLDTIGISDVSDLLIQFFGKTLKDKIIHVSSTESVYRVEAWLSAPTYTYPNRSKQMVIINGRVIKSSIIQKMIFDVYRDVIPSRRFPMVLIRIDMPGGDLDVNIHPRKQEVKFLSPDTMFRFVPSVLKSAFTKQHGLDGDKNRMPYYQKEFETRSFSDPVVNPDSGLMMMPTPSLFDDSTMLESAKPHMEFIQVFDTYIILKALDALWILDQHAVHERILYERFKTKQVSDHNLAQPLLISEVVELTTSQYMTYDSNSALFKEMGFDIEPFGDNQIVIRSIPAVFADCRLSDWLKTLLDDVQDYGGQTNSLPDRKDALQLKACKAAIKAGKPLYHEEVSELVNDFISSPSNYTCPHGRPLFLRYDKGALETMFLRR